MNAYAFTRLIHVLVAVLGIGLITAGAILTRPSTGLAPIAIRSLARWASAAMLVMFVSGMLLDYFSAGAFHHATWFRLAIAASIAAGVVVGYARRAIGQAIAGKSDSERAVRRAAGAIRIALVLVAFIVVLMVRRPFE